ncbi:hypothetical protein [uncultured Sphingomonas sp.]|uniref:hypothetical protein n=1 Tax=uncultured Sphingomonas sp. TaxID=158754 RepID=UPI0035CC91AF
MSHKPAFTPVASRHREDGWTAERQVAFVEALAATANVQAACKAVGMSTSSAYDLRARPGATSFREAWGVALDYAVHRLGEAAFDPALNGTATPVFFQGEQIGERRRFDEKLTMFILRLRDPERFGRWREAMTPMACHGRGSGQAHEFHAARLAVAVARVGIDAEAAETGAAVPPRPPRPSPRLLSTREVEALERALAQRTVERHG